MEKNNKNELNNNEEEISKIKEENLDEVANKGNDDNNKNTESGELHELINGKEKEEKKAKKKEKTSTPFFKNILANILDQAIVLAFSAVVMLLFDFIIRLIGYMVVMPVPVLLTIYFIVNCIYGPIMEKTKLRKTIAKKILNI